MTEMVDLTDEQLDFTIRMKDCQRAGHCPLGVRKWFGAQGLDFRAFLKDGIPAKTMWDTEDGQGRQVVMRAYKARQETGE